MGSHVCWSRTALIARRCDFNVCQTSRPARVPRLAVSARPRRSAAAPNQDSVLGRTLHADNCVAALQSGTRSNPMASGGRRDVDKFRAGGCWNLAGLTHMMGTGQPDYAVMSR